MVGRDGAMTDKIPYFEESYEEAVAKEKILPDTYSPIGHVIGVAETRPKALERMLENAKGVDVICGVKYSSKPLSKYYLTERCEGNAYRKNSPPSQAA